MYAIENGLNVFVYKYIHVYKQLYMFTFIDLHLLHYYYFIISLKKNNNTILSNEKKNLIIFL